MPDIDVFCGGLQPGVGARGPKLLLDTAAPDGTPGKVNLRLDHITRRMAAHVPDRLVDLLEIASYVYCADQFSRRDTPEMHRMGAKWRRRFRYRIPVRDLPIWSRTDVLEALMDTLGFLSEDQYSFEFIGADSRAGLQPYLDLHGEGAPSGFDPEQIVLFSGGLDSFAGCAEALLKGGKRVALVSHQSSPFVRSKQMDLVDELRQRTQPGQLFWVSVAVNKGREEATEYTQRSRSFLFATLGFVLARLFRKGEIVFFENGVVSLNLPVSEHVLGARATRTTHPQVLSGLNCLFSLLAEEPIRVTNPYFWLTKADVVRRIAKIGCGDVIARTFSCARVREATQHKRHCGVCSQCVDRRFGVLAAGLEELEPADFYGLDLFTGGRQPGPDLTLAESYVLTASKFASLSEPGFLSRYGQVYRALPFLDGNQTENTARLHQLHQRHGAGVVGVVGAQLAAHATLEKTLGLPETCLLSMIQTQVAKQPAFLDLAEIQPSASRQALAQSAPELERPIRLAVDQDGSRVLFHGGPVLTGKAFQLVAELATEFRQDQVENIMPADYRHVDAGRLAQRLDIEEPSLRQLIRRARKRLTAEFRDKAGVNVGDDEVIQNTGWKGYRLNPYLIIQPPALIEAQVEHKPEECHNSPGEMSQLSEQEA